MKYLKDIHDKPNENFDMDLASLMRGRALQLVKAVEDSNSTNAGWKWKVPIEVGRVQSSLSFSVVLQQ